MIGKHSSHGRGLDIILEHQEVREEVIRSFVLSVVSKAFESKGLQVPEGINISKYIADGPLEEGKAIVKPFIIQTDAGNVEIPLFIKQTHSSTKLLIAPRNGLCPKIVRETIDEMKQNARYRILIPNVPSPAPIPIGLYPQSTH